MPPQPNEPAPVVLRPSSRFWAWLALIFILLLIGAVRLHRSNLPLERDEGEYAYAGQLILEGVAPYKLAYNMKLPGSYACYALIMGMFGQSAVGIRVGLLLVNAGSILLLFIVARRLFSSAGAVAAAATFALMSASPSVLGLAAHATQFVVFFALAGILLLLKAVESNRRSYFFWSGILFGLAFLMKQPGIFFSGFALFWIFWNERRTHPLNWKRCGQSSAILIGGVAIPFAATCLLLSLAGVFDRFWFWTFGYAQSYGGLASWSKGAGWLWEFFRNDDEFTWLFWMMALAGILLSALRKEVRCHAGFLISLFLFSAAAVCVGLYFRPHYFVLVLPAVALLTGAAFDVAEKIFRGLKQTWLRLIPMIGFSVVWVGVFMAHIPVFFAMSNDEANYWLYYGNPFKETVEISQYIRDHSAPGDSIVVLGSEPEIYFYARRHSATGYIYTYPLSEPTPFAQQMQQEMIREIEGAKPKFFVVIGVKRSWGALPKPGDSMYIWSNDYLRENYTKVFTLPVEETNTTKSDTPNKAGSFLFLFERKTT